MKKKTIVELVIIAVLALALVPATSSLVQRTRMERRPAVPKSTGSGMASKVPEQALNAKPGIKIRRIKDDSFYVRLLRVADVLPLDRDPFSFSGIGPKSSRDGLDLGGILWEGETPTAIIDGGFYKVGDSTEQFTVVKVMRDKVILKDQTGEFELRLKS